MAKRILVVDDARDQADFLARRLTTRGYAVDVAYDGQQALGMLESTDYDLVITDLLMPQRTGYTVIRTAKGSIRKENNVPVIAVSASSQEDLDKARTIGAVSVYRKPYKIKVIMNRVGELIGEAASD